MSYRFELVENNTVHIYADDSEVPCLVQDANPLGKPWKSAAEATKWAETYLKDTEQRIAESLLPPVEPEVTEPVVPPTES